MRHVLLHLDLPVSGSGTGLMRENILELILRKPCEIWVKLSQDIHHSINCNSYKMGGWGRTLHVHSGGMVIYKPRYIHTMAC